MVLPTLLGRWPRLRAAPEVVEGPLEGFREVHAPPRQVPHEHRRLHGQPQGAGARADEVVHEDHAELRVRALLHRDVLPVQPAVGHGVDAAEGELHGGDLLRRPQLRQQVAAAILQAPRHVGGALPKGLDGGLQELLPHGVAGAGRMLGRERCHRHDARDALCALSGVHQNDAMSLVVLALRLVDPDMPQSLVEGLQEAGGRRHVRDTSAGSGAGMWELWRS
mmetsp:Transcript_4453/g.12589  ORF Transcript_4453/g.12589 Transcript_4453/m.12589 type:complete len:222 (+) Transcript_4453:706-1371(+)